MTLVASELLYRYKLTRKSQEQEALFGSSRNSVLDLRHSGDKPAASLGKS